MTQFGLLFHDGCPGTPWVRSTRFDPIAAELADRHYSRQTPGSPQFLPPGATLTLVAPGAVWGVCFNLDPTGRPRWRVTLFRNEGPWRSSELVASATALTYAWWRVPPASELETEVDPRRVRHKRDPGRCFLRSGVWRYRLPRRRGRPQTNRRGLVELVALPVAA